MAGPHVVAEVAPHVVAEVDGEAEEDLVMVGTDVNHKEVNLSGVYN